MLVDILQASKVDFPTLEQRYGTLLELVRKLIGVIPNCDAYLEIWPPAFRSYNVMVPNFLNLPFFLWGIGAPKPPVGLAMYAASRAAECPYCSAHTCSFALRRGAASLEGSNDGERAAIAMGRALGRVPADFTVEQRDELLRHFSAGDAEWVMLGAAMMGFLNKFMDAMGVELETSTVDEVGPIIGASGWSTGKLRVVPAARSAPSARDGLALKLGLIRFLPSALALDRKWTAGVPDAWPAVGNFLREKTGHDFPVLQKLTHGRAVRAAATMLRDNCVESVVGLDAKHRAGIIFATVMQNPALLEETITLARHAGAKDIEATQSLGREEIDFDDAAEVDRVVRANGPALLLAKAASYSPARVSPLVVERAGALPPQGVVEIVTWLAVLQLYHRLGSFHSPLKLTPAVGAVASMTP